MIIEGERRRKSEKIRKAKKNEKRNYKRNNEKEWKFKGNGNENVSARKGETRKEEKEEKTTIK